MAKANIDKEQEIAKANKWNRLWTFPIEVWEPLTDSERADLSMVQAECHHKIQDLKDRKKVVVKQIQSDIEKQQEAQAHAADTVRLGSKQVEKVLPCFYDPVSHQRVFIDSDTGEEVTRRQANEDDRQMRIA